MSPVPFKKKQSEGEKYHKEESDWALSTADEHNEKWLNGAEHDKHIMLQELKKCFKPKFYNKITKFSSDRIRRLFGILRGIQ